jgi:hypothetical protein
MTPFLETKTVWHPMGVRAGRCRWDGGARVLRWDAGGRTYGPIMASEDPTATARRMIREPMWVVRPEGTHLSQASTPGGYSSLARDDATNELETHATLFPFDGGEREADPSPALSHVSDEQASGARAEEPSVLEVLLRVVVVVGALEAGRRLASHARRWWDDLALPAAVTSTWHKLVGTRGTDGSAATDESATDPSQELVVALAEPHISMSSAEARERLVAALLARLFSDEQLRILRSARIEDEDGSPELARAMEGLTPEHIGDQLQRVLEADPSLLHEEAVAQIDGPREQTPRWRARAVEGRHDHDAATSDRWSRNGRGLIPAGSTASADAWVSSRTRRNSARSSDRTHLLICSASYLRDPLLRGGCGGLGDHVAGYRTCIRYLRTGLPSRT